MKIVLADLHWKHLLPLTFSRPLSHLLVGIDTIFEKWTRHLGEKPSLLPPSYMQEAFPAASDPEAILVNSALIPSAGLVQAIRNLKAGEVLTHRGVVLASRSETTHFGRLSEEILDGKDFSFSKFGDREVFYNDSCRVLANPADIFSYNDAILRSDYAEITSNYHTLDPGPNVIFSGSDIYIHPTATIRHAVINAENGPVYIGKHAEIMEGSLIRGPFALGEHATLKMGAKIYGATSIGAYAKVGGEVNNSVINAFSNKGHDGFLGNAVIGSWCNLGADTNTSNLKNNYSEVKVWSYLSEKMENSGRQFHGLIMGDHSRAGINTMFNTGTVTGMCVNSFDSGFPDKFIPSFSWGSPGQGFEEFKMEKAREAAVAMMERRGVVFTEGDQKIFEFVRNFDRKSRKLS